MTPRTVVFDVGGVIVRWQPLQLMREHLPTVPDDASAARMAQVFQSLGAGCRLARLRPRRVEPDVLAERIARAHRLPARGRRALIAAIPAHLQPMPDSLALIERVRAAGHRLALLSNMPRPYADHLEAAHDCFAWFEHRAWSGRLGVMKPERAFFDHLRGALALDRRTRCSS